MTKLSQSYDSVGHKLLIIPWSWLKKHAGDSVHKVQVSLVLRNALWVLVVR
jgi:hypothetical protein